VFCQLRDDFGQCDRIKARPDGLSVLIQSVQDLYIKKKDQPVDRIDDSVVEKRFTEMAFLCLVTHDALLTELQVRRDATESFTGGAASTYLLK
jgi:hypothetical protein